MQFFLPLCFQLLSIGMIQLKKMAKVQPTLQRYLFEGRCEHLQLGFVSRESSVFFFADAEKASTEVSDAISSSALASVSGNDCMLLNTFPTPAPEPDIVVLDPTTVSPSHNLARKRNREYDLNHHF
jgi:hypothetical protein